SGPTFRIAGRRLDHPKLRVEVSQSGWPNLPTGNSTVLGVIASRTATAAAPWSLMTQGMVRGERSLRSGPALSWMPDMKVSPSLVSRVTQPRWRLTATGGRYLFRACAIPRWVVLTPRRGGGVDPRCQEPSIPSAHGE